LLQRRPPHWRAAALAVGGIVAYLITTTLIIPHFRTRSRIRLRQPVRRARAQPAFGAGHIVAHPWHAMKLLVTPSAKVQTLSCLVVPFAFLFLRSPYAVLAVPLLAERLFNSRRTCGSRTSTTTPAVAGARSRHGGRRRQTGPVPATVGARRARFALAAWLVAVPLLLPFYGFGAHPYAWTKMRNTAASRARQRCRPRAPSWPTCRGNVCIEATQARPAPDQPRLRDLPTRRTGRRTSSPWTSPPRHRRATLRPRSPPGAGRRREQGYVVIFRQAKFVLLQSPHYTGPSSECHR